MSKKATIIISAVALFIGVGIGNAGASDTAAPAPAVTITSEPVVKTETVTKVEVPAACLSALDEADSLNAISATVFGLVSGHLQADAEVWTGLGNGDVSVLTPAVGKMRQFTDDISAQGALAKGNTYTADRDACRAS